MVVCIGAEESFTRECGLAAVTDAGGRVVAVDIGGLGLCMAKYMGLPYTETYPTVHRDDLLF